MLPTLAILAAGLTCGSGDYAWPLALEPQLTSSFAEYRAGRFHAGIDLRTSGVGRDVFAAGDGYVSRVRCSSYGYGKAVYLQLADGNVAVYAHLSEFFPALSAFVHAEQHRKKAYAVDLQLKPSQFPIRRGQLIAESGQTGIGAPHLHFEMRDASQAPVNPRLLGFDWPDSSRPRIQKILVAPKGMEGRVNGDVLPVALPVTQDEQGRFRTAPVHAAGLVGFGADVTDPGSGGYNLGVHELKLMSGGAEVFRMQHDRMSYTNHRNGAVAYHPYMLGEGRFLLLWRWPGNQCHSYQYSPGDGWLPVGPDVTEVSVVAADFYGNSVSVQVPVIPDGGRVGPAVAGFAPSVDLDVWGPELLVTVRLDSAPAVPPLLQTGIGLGAPFEALSDTLFRTAFRPRQSGLYTLNVTREALPPYSREVGVFVQGDKATTLQFDEMRVTAGPNAPYGALFLRGWKDTSPPACPMPARSAAYQLWPGDAPIFDPVTVSFPLDSGVSYGRTIHVYRHRGSYWSREDTAYRDGRVEIETRSPGLFMALEDTAPPSFANVVPADGYAAQTRRPAIRADVSDSGSGIAGYSITCGGRWLLAAFDPERGQIFWEQDEDLPPGTQELTYVLTDEAGNSKSYSRRITIPG